MNDGAKILVVEDEPGIRAFVRASLEREGFRVTEAPTAALGIDGAARDRPDLVLLDLGLPDRDGVAMIRELRLWSTVPILVLSARTTEPDKVDALDAGADDYLAKPFGVAELLARVRAALRRATTPSREAPVQTFGDVTVDHVQHRVTRAGDVVHLTPIEYQLLTLMVANAGRVLTHRQVLRSLWGGTSAENSTLLRVHVGNLRRKLEADASRPRHIVTETGVGYRFLPD